MSNNNKGKLSVVHPQVPSNLVAQLVITAFTDRAPAFQCSGDLATALRLLSVGVLKASQELERQQAMGNGQADPADKKREYLGPRETKVYDKGKG